MNLQEELTALKERIAELEEQVKEEQEFPQDDDEYWFIGGDGEVYNAFYHNDDIDRDYRSMGNIFKTEEQAEFAAEKLKVEAELRKFSRPFERGSLNFIMCFDVEENKLYSETRRFMTQGAFYFEHIGKIDFAIKSVGAERIKKYIFGVED